MEKVQRSLATKRVLIPGSKGGDNGLNNQFLGVSDFGYWHKGNVQEFSSFSLNLNTSAENAANSFVSFENYRQVSISLICYDVAGFTIFSLQKISFHFITLL